MALGYILEWSLVNIEAFACLVQAVEWHLDVLAGNVVYDAADGGRVLAITAWDSAADFGRFYTRQLLPALGDIGLPQPAISSWPIPEPNTNPTLKPNPGIPVRFGPWLTIHPGQASGFGRGN